MTLKQLARKLRRRQTPEEEMLWARLRNRQYGFKFRRQENMKKAFPDFICYERRVWVREANAVDVVFSQHSGQ